LKLKLKTAIKEEEKPKVQESMPTLTNALESHAKKVNATATTSTTSTKLTLEIVVIVVSISIVILSCFAAYGFVNPFANSNSDQYPQCRGEVLEKARIGEVHGAEQVISALAKCE
jgi:hypothetical protein